MALRHVGEGQGLPTTINPGLIVALVNLFREHGFAINSLIERWAPTSPAQITANQNNYDIGDARVLRLSTDLARNVTGFARGERGRMLLVVNIGANLLNLTHQDVASIAANRIITSTGATVGLSADDTALLWHDDVTARWRHIA